jgi:hypothetical protein
METLIEHSTEFDDLLSEIGEREQAETDMETTYGRMKLYLKQTPPDLRKGKQPYLDQVERR